jgi:hypothetical protein
MSRHFVVGVLAGWALWAAVFAIGYGYLTGDGLVIGGRTGFAAAVLSMPVSFGGWVYIWGDGPGQPPAFVNALWFTVLLGLVLYGALGAMAAAVYARLRNRPKDKDAGAHA